GLRTARRCDEAGAMSAGLGQQRGGDRRDHVEAAAGRQYAELFAALPVPSYLTYGNVDLPALWPDYLRPGQQVLDGERLEFGGGAFGFLRGGAAFPHRAAPQPDIA